MTAEQLQQIEALGGLVDLSGRAKFRLTGADRVRYLNGQVTNDVRQAAASRSLYACVTDAKGRIAADIFVHAPVDGGTLLLDAEGGVREMLAARLERYIVADDVELADVSEEWRLWHVFGPAAQGLSQGLACNRLGSDGVDLWQPVDAPPPGLTCPILSADDHETLRILRAVPRHPQELNGDTFPPEAGIEARAMSYTKGCYIGQEVLSRIRTTGKMPRQLMAWRSAATVTAGETVFDAGDPARAIGIVTSSAWHPLLESHCGLAFVKQGAATPHSRLPVGADQPRIDAAIEMFAFVN